MPYLRCYFASKKASPKFLLHANTITKLNLHNDLTAEIFVPYLGMHFQRVKDDPHIYGVTRNLLECKPKTILQELRPWPTHNLRQDRGVL
jgi:hypothetical protein